MNIKNYLLRIYLWLRGRDIFTRLDVKVNYELIGSVYGSWPVITSFMSRDSIIYSFGVGTDASFDIGIIEKIGSVVFGFDPTPEANEYVRSNITTDKFIMHEYGLHNKDGSVIFHMPKNSSHVSCSIYNKGGSNEICVEMRRLSTIMAEKGHDQIDVLKMDIEGAEYGVIEDMVAGSILPKQLLIEFHHRFSDIDASMTKEAVSLLRSTGYLLFYISENGTDYAFVRSDLLWHQD